MSQNRYRALWVLFVVQALCTLYFVGDALGNLGGADSEEPDGLWDLPEYVATFALLISTGFTGIELRRAMHREARMRDQLAVASGAFGEVLERYFDDWTLTEAERAVAMLAIKSFSVAEIAGIRSTKEGTVKAQNAAIYRKAGVSGRPQMLSLFIDELMEGSLAD